MRRSEKKGELADWYPSEVAKRSFGRICQTVNEQGTAVHLLGSRDAPLLVLADADDYPATRDEFPITIDEAKADWPAVMTAAALGTRFRINGRKVTRAVLYRNPKAEYPVDRYLRSSSPDVNRLARQLEELATEIRKLAVKFTQLMDENLARAAQRLDNDADTIERRFREIWRHAMGLPISPTAAFQ